VISIVHCFFKKKVDIGIGDGFLFDSVLVLGRSNGRILRTAYLYFSYGSKFVANTLRLHTM
jgi:hypothetical protein